MTVAFVGSSVKQPAHPGASAAHEYERTAHESFEYPRIEDPEELTLVAGKTGVPTGERSLTCEKSRGRVNI